MKVKVLAILITLTLCVSLAGVLAPPFSAPVQADELHVGLGQTYATIQEAVNNATAGDTIIVYDGTYDGAVVNKTGLTIRSSDGPEQTIITQHSEEVGFEVTEPGVIIDGFNITGYVGGIWLVGGPYGADNCTIKNNIIEYNGCGIQVDTENNTISNNTIRRNVNYDGTGIRLTQESSINLIINNNITDNGHGIWIEAGDTKVLGNNIFNNTANSTAPGSGVHVAGDLVGVCIEFNNIVGNSGSNSYGVYSNSTSWDFFVDAYNNWWGNATGPYVPGPYNNPEGTGDAVSGDYVDFWYWLGAPLVLPIHYEELVGSGLHVVNATAEADTTANLTIAEGTDSLDIVIARYESHPFPDVTFPDLPLGKFIDIGFLGIAPNNYENRFVWPIHVEMNYTDEELSETAINETTLGFYYLKSKEYQGIFSYSYARRWAHTGVDTASNTIWADLVGTDFWGGSPFGTGGLAGPGIFAPDIYVSDATGNDAWDGQSPAWNGTSGPKKTIQGGIDAVAVGGTVHVENGTYSVDGPYVAYVDKPNITIRSSDGPGAAIVSDPGGYGVDGFKVGDSGVTIDGFNITGFNHDILLYRPGWRADNCTIKNNILESYTDAGIDVETSGNILSNNTIPGPGRTGIRIGPHSVRDCNGNLIINNIITGNSNEGVYIYSASGNKILGNNILNNAIGILLFYNPSEGNVVHFNNIAGNVYENIYYGIENYYSSANVSADNNWWGNATGPYDSADNPGGTGDGVRSYDGDGVVLYRPWLGAPLQIPAIHYETLSAGTFTVNASAEAGTTVALTVLAGNQTDIDIGRYESPPFPGASFPDEALGIYIDILVSNPDAVDWPIQVNVTYTDEQVTAAGIDESTLVLYYYNATASAFVRCSNTGVDTANNIIWANVTAAQAGYLSGTPFGAGGLPANTPPVAYNQTVYVTQNQPKSITLAADDVDNDPLTYSIVQGPSHGMLSGSPPNLTYTPNAGYVGTDSFTFKANDGMADSNIATVSITIEAPTLTPTLSQWGMIAMAILFVGALSWTLRRRLAADKGAR